MKRDLRSLVMKAFKREPTATLGQVAGRLGVSIPTVHYHVTMLERDGKVKRAPRSQLNKESVQERRLATRKAKWRRFGMGKLPRLSKDRQAELIEKVIEKAQGSGRETDGEMDVIRVEHNPFLRLKCHRVG